jgi:signal transduction histidine kinase
MSAAVTREGENKKSRRSAGMAPLGLRVFFVTVSCLALVSIALGVGDDPAQFYADLPILLGWLAVSALADLIAVPLWDSVTFSMSLPVSLAAGMLFAPAEAALVAFVATSDPREFRGEITLDHAAYNRSQVSISVLLASATFHSLGGNPRRWPEVVLPFALALGADFVVNTVLVVVPVGILRHLPPWRVFMKVHGDTPLRHFVGYMCLGSLALILAAVYEVAGVWGMFVFAIPLVLARQMFLHVRQLEEAALRIEEKNRAVLSSLETVADERRDERMNVAGELHDEVLPPLFKVHLMGQVLRQDLNSGRLLDLDEDLPELLAATDAAQYAIRSLVGDLRRSPLGTGGLSSTLNLLIQQLEAESDSRIVVSIEDEGGSNIVQLLLYQVAREALGNAVRYAQASLIELRIWRHEGLLRICIEDNGIGFDPRLVDRNQHFGLQLISERIESARGTLIIDSAPGVGTRVVASLPPHAS